MRIITIAGENKGAFMELIKSPSKQESGEKSRYLYKKGTGKLAKNGSETESNSSSSSSSSSGEEGNSKKDSSSKANKAKNGSLPLSAFMNSNVQGINNSIMYNSSCAHHDPGVHLALTRKPNGGGFQVKERVSGHDQN